MVTKLPMRSFGLDIFGVCPLKGGGGGGGGWGSGFSLWKK